MHGTVLQGWHKGCSYLTPTPMVSTRGGRLQGDYGCGKSTSCPTCRAEHQRMRFTSTLGPHYVCGEAAAARTLSNTSGVVGLRLATSLLCRGVACVVQ